MLEKSVMCAGKTYHYSECCEECTLKKRAFLHILHTGNSQNYSQPPAKLPGLRSQLPSNRHQVPEYLT